ncbi:MAG: outer membrane beta-barrel protein [Rhizobacter sp.]|nr:outer membrane beta-barrel protein [Chlorobiales bacterium]
MINRFPPLVLAVLLLTTGCGTVYEGSSEQRANEAAVQVAKDSVEQNKPKALPPLYTSGAGFAFQFGMPVGSGVGVGLRAGYSAGNQLYFGASYTLYIGGVFGFINVVPTNFALEAGYEIPASFVILRPYLQAGLLRIETNSDIFDLTPSSQEDFYFAPSALLQLPLRGSALSFHFDTRYIIVPSRNFNTFGLHVGIGFKF